jgi:hypothetical protein
VKRRKRAYLFMTGDEKPYPILSRHVVEAVTGDHLDDDLKVEEVVAELQKTFTSFFIIPDHERRHRCERAWRDLLGEHVLCMENPADICYVTAGALLLSERLVSDLRELEAVLLGSGMPKDRRGAVVRTLKPLAEAQGVRGGDSFWRFWS